MAKAIGPTFGAELTAAGLATLPFSWGGDGTLFLEDKALTDQQRDAIKSVYAAHDPTAVMPVVPTLQEQIDALRADIEVLKGTVPSPPVP